jgi:phosphoribosyl 1,2-cyclic phosphate phosphodiesterase
MTLTLKLTLTGTGDAAGVPVWGCRCRVCTAAAADPALRRGACGGLLEVGAARVLLDAGMPDLVRRFAPTDLDAIVLTHFHVDHVQGLFEARWGAGPELPVYCPPDPEGCADLYKHPGMLTFLPLEAFKSFRIGEAELTPVPLLHSKLTYGYLIRAGDARLAYITDTRDLGPKTAAALEKFQPQVLVIDAKFPPGHQSPRNHNDVDIALRISRACGAGRTVLVHLSHETDGWLQDHPGYLPEGVETGRDGQKISLAGCA